MKKWWKVPLIVALFTLGCTIFVLTPPAIGPVTTNQLIAYERSVTPKIEAFDNYGNHLWWASGVWIDSRHVLTAAHVVQADEEGRGTPTCWLISGKYSATKVKIDVNHDVAMLTLDEERVGPMAQISQEPLKVGDEVVMCGWVMGMGLETTWGRVANVVGQGLAEGDVVCGIACGPGASGGPVFRGGKVVGIVSRGVPGFLVIEPICMGVK